MSEIEELYENFPTILKEKLRNKEIEFPSNTKFDYEKIYVYRAVSREIKMIFVHTLNLGKSLKN